MKQAKFVEYLQKYYQNLNEGEGITVLIPSMFNAHCLYDAFMITFPNKCVPDNDFVKLKYRDRPFEFYQYSIDMYRADANHEPTVMYFIDDGISEDTTEKGTTRSLEEKLMKQAKFAANLKKSYENLSEGEGIKVRIPSMLDTTVMGRTPNPEKYVNNNSGSYFTTETTPLTSSHVKNNNSGSYFTTETTPLTSSHVKNNRKDDDYVDIINMEGGDIDTTDNRRWFDLHKDDDDETDKNWFDPDPYRYEYYYNNNYSSSSSKSDYINDPYMNDQYKSKGYVITRSRDTAAARRNNNYVPPRPRQPRGVLATRYFS